MVGAADLLYMGMIEHQMMMFVVTKYHCLRLLIIQTDDFDYGLCLTSSENPSNVLISSSCHFTTCKVVV